MRLKHYLKMRRTRIATKIIITVIYAKEGNVSHPHFSLFEKSISNTFPQSPPKIIPLINNPYSPYCLKENRIRYVIMIENKITSISL